MKLIFSSIVLCFVIVANVAAEKDDRISLSNTNLIVTCARKSDVVAHAKLLSITFIRKPKEEGVIDLSVYGRLFTLQIEDAYLPNHNVTNFPTNIYIYRAGAMGGSFLEPTLEIGHKYLLFLNEGKDPEIVKKGTVTDPPLPTENYFTFVHLPQREMRSHKAYMTFTNTNVLTAVENILAKSATIKSHVRKQKIVGVAEEKSRSKNKKDR
jgi:hypothetical protein